MKKSLIVIAIALVTIHALYLPVRAQSAKDADGNEYTVRPIGARQWMEENLNVSRFRNGDPIPEARTPEEWAMAGARGEPAWCYYDNDTANGRKFGKLYNWHATNDPRGLAPEGWHIPNNADWKALTGFLGGVDLAGIKLKKTGGWSQVTKANNKSNYSALPAGTRDSSGKFQGLNNMCQWWSASKEAGGSDKVYTLMLKDNSIEVFYLRSDRSAGYSVRCVKD